MKGENMGSYSPPPLKLEVEKSSWSEIGRIPVLSEHTSVTPPFHITWNEKRRIAIYSTSTRTLTLNFANFTYTVQPNYHYILSIDYSHLCFSILGKYEVRTHASTGEMVVRNDDKFITIPNPPGFPPVEWQRLVIQPSPSGRYLVMQYWRDYYVPGEYNMVFVFYR